MAEQTVNIGTIANDGTGDPLRTAFTKLNQNFDEIYVIKEDTANKAVANGYASLDSTAKIPIAQIPDSVVGQVSYQGTWDASTNTPTIPAAATSNKGDYYKVSVAGSTTIDGILDWKVQDWIISDGVVWGHVDNTESVSSVASKTGAVVLDGTDIANTPAGNIAATDVQSALNELDTEKEPANANIQAHIVDTANPHGVTASQAGAAALAGADFTGRVTMKFGADITTGGTITLGDGNAFHLTTSTAAITDFTHITGSGSFLLITDTVRTITHAAGVLETNTGADITTAAGDRFRLDQDSDGTTWLITQEGAAGSVNIVQTLKQDVFTTTSATPTFVDITGASVTISLSSTASRVKISIYAALSNENSRFSTQLRLLRGTTLIASGTAVGNRTAALAAGTYEQEASFPVGMLYLDSPATSGSVTYKLQLAAESGSIATIGRTGLDNSLAFYSRFPTILIAEEIGA